MHVLLDTSPLTNANAHRGVGVYTKFLVQELRKLPSVEVSESQDEAKIKQKPVDLVHYPYFDLFFHTLPLIKPARKSVVTIHDVIPLQFPEQYKPGKKGTLAFALQKLSLRTVTKVITDSLSSKEAITEYLPVAAKDVVVIPLAANPKLVKPDQKAINQVKSRLDLPDKYLLYVGDINYNKNIPQLVKSLKYIDESVHLVLFGKNFRPQQIPEWQWIETQIALSNVANRVHMVTEVEDDAELAALYAGATAYVQPSLAEGFGLPLLEALQCETLVVSSRETSLPEVGGEQAVYVDPTAEDIAKGVESVLSLATAEAKKRKAAGLAWTKKFTWRKTAVETAKVYETLT